MTPFSASIALLPRTFISGIGDIAAGVVSMRFGAKGPNFATISACSTSAVVVLGRTAPQRSGFASGFCCVAEISLAMLRCGIYIWRQETGYIPDIQEQFK